MNGYNGLNGYNGDVIGICCYDIVALGYNLSVVVDHNGTKLGGQSFLLFTGKHREL